MNMNNMNMGAGNWNYNNVIYQLNQENNELKLNMKSIIIENNNLKTSLQRAQSEIFDLKLSKETLNRENNDLKQQIEYLKGKLKNGNQIHFEEELNGINAFRRSTSFSFDFDGDTTSKLAERDDMIRKLKKEVILLKEQLNKSDDEKYEYFKKCKFLTKENQYLLNQLEVNNITVDMGLITDSIQSNGKSKTSSSNFNSSNGKPTGNIPNFNSSNGITNLNTGAQKNNTLNNKISSNILSKSAINLSTSSEQLNLQIQQLERENIKYVNKIDELSTTLTLKDKQIKGLEQNKIKLDNDLNLLRTELMNIGTNNKEMIAQNEQLKIELKQRNDRMMSLEEKYRNEESTLRKKIEDLDIQLKASKENPFNNQNNNYLPHNDSPNIINSNIINTDIPQNSTNPFTDMSNSNNPFNNIQTDNVFNQVSNIFTNNELGDNPFNMHNNNIEDTLDNNIINNPFVDLGDGDGDGCEIFTQNNNNELIQNIEQLTFDNNHLIEIRNKLNNDNDILREQNLQLNDSLIAERNRIVDLESRLEKVLVEIDVLRQKESEDNNNNNNDLLIPDGYDPENYDFTIEEQPIKPVTLESFDNKFDNDQDEAKLKFETEKNELINEINDLKEQLNQYALIIPSQPEIKTKINIDKERIQLDISDNILPSKINTIVDQLCVFSGPCNKYSCLNKVSQIEYDRKYVNDQNTNFIENINSSNHDHENPHHDLNCNYNGLQIQYNDLNSKYNDLNNEFNIMKQSFDVLTTQYNEINEKLIVTTAEYNDANNNYNIVNSKYNDLLNNYNELNDEYNTSKTSLDEIDTIRNNQLDFQRQIQDYQNLISELNTEKSSLVVELSEYKSTIDVNTSNITKSEHFLDDTDDFIQQQSKNIETINELKNQVLILEDEIVRLNSFIQNNYGSNNASNLNDQQYYNNKPGTNSFIPDNTLINDTEGVSSVQDFTFNINQSDGNSFENMFEYTINNSVSNADMNITMNPFEYVQENSSVTSQFVNNQSEINPFEIDKPTDFLQTNEFHSFEIDQQSLTDDQLVLNLKKAANPFDQNLTATETNPFNMSQMVTDKNQYVSNQMAIVQNPFDNNQTGIEQDSFFDVQTNVQTPFQTDQPITDDNQYEFNQENGTVNSFIVPDSINQQSTSDNNILIELQRKISTLEKTNDELILGNNEFKNLVDELNCKNTELQNLVDVLNNRNNDLQEYNDQLMLQISRNQNEISKLEGHINAERNSNDNNDELNTLDFTEDNILVPNTSVENENQLFEDNTNIDNSNSIINSLQKENDILQMKMKDLEEHIDLSPMITDHTFITDNISTEILSRDNTQNSASDVYIPTVVDTMMTDFNQDNTQNIINPFTDNLHFGDTIDIPSTDNNPFGTIDNQARQDATQSGNLLDLLSLNGVSTNINNIDIPYDQSQVTTITTEVVINDNKTDNLNMSSTLDNFNQMDLLSSEGDHKQNNNKIAELVTMNNELTIKVDQLEAMNNELSLKVSELETMKQEEIAHKIIMTEKINNGYADFNDNKGENRCIDLEPKFFEYEKRIGEYEDRIREFENQQSVNIDNLMNQNEKISEYENKINDYENKINDYENKINDYENKISEYENKITQLYTSQSAPFYRPTDEQFNNQQISYIDSEFNETTNINIDENNVPLNKENDTDNNISSISNPDIQLNNETNEKNNRIISLESENEQLTLSINELTHSLAEKEQIIQDLTSKIIELENNASIVNNVPISEDISFLTSENVRITNKLSEMESTLESSKLLHTQMTDNFLLLTNDYNLILQQKAEVDNDNNYYRDRTNELELKISELEHGVSDLESKVREKEHKISELEIKLSEVDNRQSNLPPAINNNNEDNPFNISIVAGENNNNSILPNPFGIINNEIYQITNNSLPNPFDTINDDTNTALPSPFGGFMDTNAQFTQENSTDNPFGNFAPSTDPENILPTINTFGDMGVNFIDAIPGDDNNTNPGMDPNNTHVEDILESTEINDDITNLTRITELQMMLDQANNEIESLQNLNQELNQQLCQTASGQKLSITDDINNDTSNIITLAEKCDNLINTNENLNNIISEYRNQVNTLESTNCDLLSQINKLDDNQNFLYVKINELENDRNSLVRQNEEIAPKLKLTETFNSDMNKQLIDYEDKIIEYESTIKNYKLKEKDYDDKIIAYEEIISENENVISQCKTEIHRYENIMKENQDKFIDQVNKITEYENQMNYNDNKINEYMNKINNYDTQISQYQNEITDYKQKINELENKINDYQNQINHEGDEMIQQESTIIEDKNIIKKYEDQIIEYKSRLNLCDEKILGLENEIAQIKNSLIEYKNVIDADKINIDEYKSIVEVYSNQIEQYKKQVTEHEEKNNHLQITISDLDSKLKLLNFGDVKIQNDLDVLKSTSSELIQVNNELKNLNNELVVKNNDLLLQVTILEASALDNEKVINNLQSQISDLKSDVNRRNDQETIRNTTLNERNITLEGEVTKLHETLNELQRENRELTTKLEYASMNEKLRNTEADHSQNYNKILHDSNTELNNNVNELNRQIFRLENLNSDQKNNITVLEDKVSLLQSRIQGLEEEKRELSRTNCNLKSLSNELEKTNQSLIDRVNTVEEKSRISTYQSHIDSHPTNRTSAESEKMIIDLENANISLKNKVNEIEDRNRKLNDNITELEIIHNNQIATNNLLNSEIKNLKSRISELNNLREKFNPNISSNLNINDNNICYNVALKNKISELETNINKLIEEKSISTDDDQLYVELRRQLDSLKRENDNFDRNNQSLLREINNLNKIKIQNDIDIKILKDENEILKNKPSLITRNISNIDNKNLSLENQNNILTSKITQIEIDNNILKKENQNLRNEAQKLSGMTRDIDSHYISKHYTKNATSGIDIKETNIKLIEYNNTIFRLNENINDLQNNEKKLKATIDDLENNEKKFKGMIDDFENNIKKLKNEIAVLENNEIQLKKHIDLLETNEKKFRIEINELEVKNKLLSSSMRDLENTYKSSETQDSIPKFEKEMIELNSKYILLESSRNELNNRIAILDNNVSNLTKTIVDLESVNSSLESELKSLRMTNRSLSNDNNELTERNHELDNTNKDFRVKIEKLRSMNNEINNKLSECEDIETALKNKICNLETINNKLNNRISELESTINDYKDLELNVIDSRPKMNITESIPRQDQEINFISKKRIEAKDNALAQLKIDNLELLSKNSEFEDVINNLNDEINRLTHRNKVLEADNSNLKKARITLESNITSLQDKINEFDVPKTTINNDNNDLSKFSSQINELRGTIAKLNVEKNNYQIFKDSYDNEHKLLNTKLSEMETSYSLLRNKSTDIEHKNFLLSEENYKLTHKLSEIEDYNQQMNLIKSEIEKSKVIIMEENKKLRVKVNELQSINMKLENTIHDLEDQIDIFVSDKNRYISEIDELNSQVSNLKGDMKRDSSKEIENLRNNIKILNEKNLNLETKLEESISSRSELQNFNNKLMDEVEQMRSYFSQRTSSNNTLHDKSSIDNIIKTKLDIQIKENKDLTNEISNLNEMIKQLRIENCSPPRRNEDISKRDQEKMLLSKENNQLIQENNKLVEENSQLSQEIIQLNLEKVEIEKFNRKLKTDNQDLDILNNQLKIQNSDLEASNDIFIGENHSLESINNQLKLDIKILEENKNILNNEISKKKSSIDDYISVNRNISTSRNDIGSSIYDPSSIRSFNNLIDNLKIENQNLHDEINKCNKKIEDSQLSHDNLLDEIKSLQHELDSLKNQNLKLTDALGQLRNTDDNIEVTPVKQVETTYSQSYEMTPDFSFYSPIKRIELSPDKYEELMRNSKDIDTYRNEVKSLNSHLQELIELNNQKDIKLSELSDFNTRTSTKYSNSPNIKGIDDNNITSYSDLMNEYKSVSQQLLTLKSDNLLLNIHKDEIESKNNDLEIQIRELKNNSNKNLKKDPTFSQDNLITENNKLKSEIIELKTQFESMRSNTNNSTFRPLYDNIFAGSNIGGSVRVNREFDDYKLKTEKENTELRREINEYMEKNAEVNMKLIDSEKKIKSLCDQVTDYENKIQNIIELNNDNQGNRLNQKNNIQNSIDENDIEQMMIEMPSLNDRMKQQIAEENIKLNNQIAILKARINTLEEESNTMEYQNNNLNDIIRKLNIELQNKKSDNRNNGQLQLEIDQLIESVNSLNDEINDLATKNSDLNNIIDSHKQQISELNKTISNLVDENNKLLSNSANYIDDSSIRKLNTTSNINSNQINQINDRKSLNLDYQIQIRDDEISKMTDQLNSFESMIIDFEDKMNENEIEVTELLSRNNQLEIKLKTLTEEHNHLLSQYDILISDKENTEQILNNKLKALTNTLDKLNHEYDILTQKLDNNKNQNSDQPDQNTSQSNNNDDQNIDNKMRKPKNSIPSRSSSANHSRSSFNDLRRSQSELSEEALSFDRSQLSTENEILNEQLKNQKDIVKFYENKLGQFKQKIKFLRNENDKLKCNKEFNPQFNSPELYTLKQEFSKLNIKLDELETQNRKLQRKNDSLNLIVHHNHKEKVDKLILVDIENDLMEEKIKNNDLEFANSELKKIIEMLESKQGIGTKSNTNSSNISENEDNSSLTECNRLRNEITKLTNDKEILRNKINDINNKSETLSLLNNEIEKDKYELLKQISELQIHNRNLKDQLDETKVDSRSSGEIGNDELTQLNRQINDLKIVIERNQVQIDKLKDENSQLIIKNKNITDENLSKSHTIQQLMSQINSKTLKINDVDDDLDSLEPLKKKTLNSMSDQKLDKTKPKRQINLDQLQLENDELIQELENIKSENNDLINEVIYLQKQNSILKSSITNPSQLAVVERQLTELANQKESKNIKRLKDISHTSNLTLKEVSHLPHIKNALDS